MTKLSFVGFGVLTDVSHLAVCSLLAGCLRGLHCNPEDGGNAVQRNIGEVPDCTLSHCN
jgi:hypothetical protein